MKLLIEVIKFFIKCQGISAKEIIHPVLLAGFIDLFLPRLAQFWHIWK